MGVQLNAAARLRATKLEDALMKILDAKLPKGIKFELRAISGVKEKSLIFTKQDGSKLFNKVQSILEDLGYTVTQEGVTGGKYYVYFQRLRKS